jgi:YD repeat-containing protein
LLEFEYDVQGNITKVKQPGNINLLTEYDLKGRKTKMIDPDMGQYQYEYNGFGELIKQNIPRWYYSHNGI